LLLGFFVFSLYLRWQPFGARLQLPLFVLGAAFMAEAIDQLHPPWIGAGVAVLLLLGCLPWLALNVERPLVGERNIFNTSRTDLYFMNRRGGLEADYLSAVNFISESSGGKCSSVGIYMDTNDFEYPVWILLKERLGRTPSIRSVAVQNISRLATGQSGQFTPCAVFVANPPPISGFQINGRAYTQAWDSQFVSVFLPR
jgi:hypothetical protein